MLTEETMDELGVYSLTCKRAKGSWRATVCCGTPENLEIKSGKGASLLEAISDALDKPVVLAEFAKPRERPPVISREELAKLQTEEALAQEEKFERRPDETPPEAEQDTKETAAPKPKAPKKAKSKKK